MINDAEQGVDKENKIEVQTDAASVSDAKGNDFEEIVMAEQAPTTIDTEAEPKSTLGQRLLQFYQTYEFLISIIAAILLAYAYPPLGATYLAADITADWVAVIYMFFISGLTLETDEFMSAFKQLKWLFFIQTYNFIFISAMVFGVTRLLISTHVLVQSLGDGMVICSCLPMAINIVIVLARNAGGDEGIAVYNSALSNMVGVILSPLLILGYLGVSGGVNIGTIFYKLVIRIVVPVVVGQLLRKFIPPMADFAQKYRSILGKTQMYTLLFIVYTVFCETFMTGTTVPASDFVLVMFLQTALLMASMTISWYCLSYLFPTEPRLRVTGVLCASFKTVAMGVPLINAMYEGSPNLAMYILPLLMWHPTQLAIGSILAPRFKLFVQRQEAAEAEFSSGKGALVVVVADDGIEIKDENDRMDHVPEVDPEMGLDSAETMDVCIR